MKRKILIAVACFFTATLMLAILLISGFLIWAISNQRADADNPMRRPNAEIRADLLELTPVGTSMEDVIRTIDRHQSWEWSDRFVAPVGFSSGMPSDDRIGVQSIQVRIGYFWSFMGNNNMSAVVAWWGFDENETLIDIRVRGINARD